MVVVGCLAIGTTRIKPYVFNGTTKTSEDTTKKEEKSDKKKGENIENEVSPFDQSMVHEVEIDITPENYQQMLDTYQNENEKEYVSANITIDGVTIENVGIRLKGNSSLKMAGRNEDKQLPFQVKFNEYVKNQTYNGLEKMAIRVGGMSEKTLLTEMVAYNLYQELWRPAPETSYAKVKVNGKEYLYTLSEIVDSEYLEKYFPEDDGILFKSVDYSDFSYLWDDPLEYTEIYEQKTNEKKDDSSQLIQFLKFINTSSDEEFAEGIENWVNVDSVLYLIAIDKLLANNDGFTNGRSNFYLYYHKGEQRFYLLTWDQNLAFGGFGDGNMPWGDFGTMGDFGSGEMPDFWKDFGRWEKRTPWEDKNTEKREKVWFWFGEWKEESSNPVPTDFKRNENQRGRNEQWGRWFPGGFQWDFPEAFSWEMPEEFPGGQDFGWNFPGGMPWSFPWWWGKWGMGNGSNNFMIRLLWVEKYQKRYEEIFNEVYAKIYDENRVKDEIQTLSEVFLSRNQTENLIDENIYQQGVEKLYAFLEKKKPLTAEDSVK